VLIKSYQIKFIEQKGLECLLQVAKTYENEKPHTMQNTRK